MRNREIRVDEQPPRAARHHGKTFSHRQASPGIVTAQSCKEGMGEANPIIWRCVPIIWQTNPIIWYAILSFDFLNLNLSSVILFFSSLPLSVLLPSINALFECGNIFLIGAGMIVLWYRSRPGKLKENWMRYRPLSLKTSLRFVGSPICLSLWLAGPLSVACYIMPSQAMKMGKRNSPIFDSPSWTSPVT